MFKKGLIEGSSIIAEKSLQDAGNATGGGPGSSSASVALTIGGGAFGVRPSPVGANLTCACGFTGNVSFACPGNATVIERACDGLPGVLEVFCPTAVDACASWNATTQAWLSRCETVESAGGKTRCECDVDTGPGGVPEDFSTTEQETDAASVYFKNLMEPPDLSRAVVMIYALLALLGACVAAHVYGRRLDARDARIRGMHAASEASDASSGNAADDPYAVPEELDVLTVDWKHRFSIGMDQAHPFYGWVTVHSESVPRPFRAWCCGFEVLVFLYALAFETNIIHPDVEEECAAKLSKGDCASLTTGLRGKFHGTHIEEAQLCEWSPCAEACFMTEPDEGDMTAMSSSQRPRGILPLLQIAVSGERRRYYLILAGMFLALLRGCCVARNRISL